MENIIDNISSLNLNEALEQRFVGIFDNRRLIQHYHRNEIQNNFRKNIGILYAVRQQKQYILGTVVLISSKFCLTAAHNLFLPQSVQAVKFTNVYVYFGARSYLNVPTPTNRNNFIKVVNYRYLEDYLIYFRYKQKRIEYDFAILQLENEVKHDSYFQMRMISNDDLMKKQIIVSGFPGQKINTYQQVIKFQQLYGVGKVDWIHQNIIYHTADTSSGQSGSPILFELNGQLYIVGIHNSSCKIMNNQTGIHVIRNRGIVLNQKIVSIIATWMREMTFNFTFKCWLNHEQINGINFLREFEWNNYFNFNWQISPHHKNSLKINQKQLTNCCQNNRNIIICSYESFNVERLTIITAKINYISGLIYVGLVNKELKQYLYQKTQINFNQLTKYGALFYQISGVFPKFGRIYSYGEIKMQDDKQLFVDCGSSIRIQVNYPQKHFLIYMNKIKLCFIQKMMNEQLFLCVGLSHNNNSISFVPF